MYRSLRNRLFSGLCVVSLLASAAHAQAPQGNSRCSAAEQARFDFWVGEWTGIEKGLRDGEMKSLSTTHVSATKILDGCALLELNEVDAGDVAFKSVTVRSFDTQKKTWMLHYTDNINNTFQVWDGAEVDGQWRFSTERILDGKKVLVRLSWTVVSRDQVTWQIDRSTDDGATWMPRSKIEFTRKK